MPTSSQFQRKFDHMVRPLDPLALPSILAMRGHPLSDRMHGRDNFGVRMLPDNR